jgi:hypothetical protein
MEKWLTTRGLLCEQCLTDFDFNKYPGWKERMQRRQQRAQIARANFHRSELPRGMPGIP